MGNNEPASVAVPDSGASLYKFEEALRAAPDAIAVFLNMYRSAFEASQTEHRMPPAWRTELAAITRLLNAAYQEAATWSPTLRQQNRPDFDRGENPAEGIHKESKHDVARDAGD